MHRRLLWVLVFFLIALPAAAQAPALPATAPAAEEESVSVHTAWSADRARPGDSVTLAVVLVIRDGYHVIADEAQVRGVRGFKPLPTRVRLLEASNGILAELPLYPHASPLKAGFVEGSVMTFEGRTVIRVPIRLDEQTPTGTAAVKLGVEYQACGADFCEIPQKVVLEAVLPVVPAGAPAAATHPDIFPEPGPPAGGGRPEWVRFDLFGWGFALDAASFTGRALLLLTAALGGLLLNCTPCVLPLVPIKVISMSQAASRPGRCAALGASTFLGVTAFWLALGGLVSAVSGFTTANQLFHYPVFTIAVGAVIAAMAVAMFGGRSMRLPNFIYSFNPAQETLGGAFGIGVLTAVLSTPCTAPFMGAAAAWAVTQTPATTLLTFFAVGAGMGAPYMALAAFPRLVSRVPRSGPASELLKQAMAIFMLAAAAYFIGTGLSTLAADPASPPSRLYWWPVMGLCALSGAWTGFRAARLTAGNIRKAAWITVGALVLAASIAGGWRLTDSGPIAWVTYTPERLDKALTERRPVVMVFTAEWCLNCKALEHSVWNDRELADLMSRAAVVPMKVDLTGSNPAGKEKLREAGSLTIPFLTVLARDGHPVFKGDFYTAVQVTEAIGKAIGETGS